jgi:catalase
MLQGRTFSYSDTQRYRVGPNYLQLPINAPKAKVATNQRDAQMTFYVDSGVNKHVNYEPSFALGGLKEAQPAGQPHEPEYHAKLVREKIARRGDVDFKQAGERYRLFEDWERDELISNLSGALAPVNEKIQERMIELFTKCDEDYGRRVREGIEERKAKIKEMQQQGRVNNMYGTEAKAPGHGAPIAGTTVGEEEGVQEARGMSTEAKAY